MQVDSNDIPFYKTFEHLGRDSRQRTQWRPIVARKFMRNRRQISWKRSCVDRLLSIWFLNCVNFFTKMPNFHQTVIALQSDAKVESASSMGEMLKVPFLSPTAEVSCFFWTRSNNARWLCGTVPSSMNYSNNVTWITQMSPINVAARPTMRIYWLDYVTTRCCEYTQKIELFDLTVPEIL